MKYLTTFIILLGCFQLSGQITIHHQDSRGRMWLIHTYQTSKKDSTICYIYGRPKGAFDRGLIFLTRKGKSFDALYYISKNKRKPKKTRINPNPKPIRPKVKVYLPLNQST